MVACKVQEEWRCAVWFFGGEKSSLNPNAAVAGSVPPLLSWYGVGVAIVCIGWFSFGVLLEPFVT